MLSWLPRNSAAAHQAGRPASAPRATPATPASRPVFESLEDRRLMSAAPLSPNALNGTFASPLKLKVGHQKLPTSEIVLNLGGASATGQVNGWATVPGIGNVNVFGNVTGKTVTLTLSGKTDGVIVGKVGKSGIKGTVKLGVNAKGKLNLKTAPANAAESLMASAPRSRALIVTAAAIATPTPFTSSALGRHPADQRHLRPHVRAGQQPVGQRPRHPDRLHLRQRGARHHPRRRTDHHQRPDAD